MKCISCGKENEKSVKFLCPECGETQVVRCESCRKLGRSYKCVKCGFTGP